MPLVRIDLQKGKDPVFRAGIGKVVYDALRDQAGAPEDDRFQIISEHDPDNFIYDSNYLGIMRTADLVMIQIIFVQGRTLDQKKALYKAIADGLSSSLGMRREDVFICLVEVAKENWSFGNGVAQYAP
jgi:phenylpyruvate tautomerase PptA (4-oxalocrotonate tautomerase family)